MNHDGLLKTCSECCCECEPGEYTTVEGYYVHYRCLKEIDEELSKIFVWTKSREERKDN